MQIDTSSPDCLPEELQCKKCLDLICDAVVLPCCGNSTCEDCFKECWSSDGACIWCETPGCDSAQPIPNKQLRQAAENYLRESVYIPKRRFKFAVKNSEPHLEDSGLCTELPAMAHEQSIPVVLPLESSTNSISSSQTIDGEVTNESVATKCVSSADDDCLEVLTVETLGEMKDCNSLDLVSSEIMKSTADESSVNSPAVFSSLNPSGFAASSKENTVPTDCLTSYDPRFYYNQTAAPMNYPMYMCSQTPYGYGQSVYPFGYPVPPIPPPFFPPRWLNQQEFYKLQLHMRGSSNKYQGHHNNGGHQSSQWNSNHKYPANASFSSRYSQQKRDHRDHPESRSSKGYHDNGIRRSRSRSSSKYKRKNSDEVSTKHRHRSSSRQSDRFSESRYRHDSRRDFRRSSRSRHDHYGRRSKSPSKYDHRRSRSRSFSRDRSRGYSRKRKHLESSPHSHRDKSSEKDSKGSLRKKEKSRSSEHRSRSLKSDSQYSDRDEEHRVESASRSRDVSQSRSSVRQKKRKAKKKQKKSKSLRHRSRSISGSESEEACLPDDSRKINNCSRTTSSNYCSDRRSESRSEKEDRLERCLEVSSSILSDCKNQSEVVTHPDANSIRMISKSSKNGKTGNKSKSHHSETSDCDHDDRKKKSFKESGEKSRKRRSNSSFSESDRSDHKSGKTGSKSSSRRLERQPQPYHNGNDNKGRNGFSKRHRSRSSSSSASSDWEKNICRKTSRVSKHCQKSSLTSKSLTPDSLTSASD